MIKTYVTTKKELDSLYNESALTWEGLLADDEGLKAVENWLKEHNAILDNTEPTAHIIKGEFMNEVYKLKGNNAYPEDCTLVSITGINQMKVAIPRFQVGGRWFDDIVDNNARREVE